MINGTTVLNYVRCPRLVWNKFYGPSEEKTAVHEFMQKKMGEGLVLEKGYIKKLPHESFSFTNLEDGFKKTLELMKKGAKRIYHPVLMYDDFVGIPDLIEKVKGKSRLGEYYYVAGDVKSTIRPKEEQVMQVVFYNHLISKVQRYLPHLGFLVMRDENRVDVNITDNISKLNKDIKMIREICNGMVISPTINSHCTFCPWKDYCFNIALNDGDISMIKGLGSSAKKILNEIGAHKIEDVAKLDPEKTHFKGFTPATVQKWKLQAESLRDDKVIKIKKHSFSSRLYEVYLDLESQDNTQVVYLIGLLVNGKVKQFTALKPEDEKKTLLEFVKYVISLKDFVIYHYGTFEKTMFRTLFKKYSVNKAEGDKIMSNMIDLLPIINSSVVLPLHSYSLKRIARYLGFKWTDKKADAAESMYWYDLWLKDGDLKWLELSTKYNEDDCKATKIIKEWLEKL
ncbi:TM0106 family RecB-like putative nuclease [Nanoarchaeota archaeon]